MKASKKIPKLVILAGGMGTRIAEESDFRPKPMIEIGGKPILVHIMEHYASHGINEFVICVGYRGYQIKEFFSNFMQHSFDFSIDLASGSVNLHDSTQGPKWKISIVDTGVETGTGGRLKKVAHLLDETFMMTYGDGLSDVNLTEELRFHYSHKRLATVLAVRPPSRFAVLEIDSGDSVYSFREKPADEVGWINGGFFVLNKEVIDLIEDETVSWEAGPLVELAKARELMAYYHNGFWQPIDTLRDKRHCEALFKRGEGMWAKSGASIEP